MSIPSNLTGACAACMREGLPASEFLLEHLRSFLAAKASARGRRMGDARDEVRSETSLVQVGGPGLFCRACVEAQNAAEAESGVWAEENDDLPRPTIQPIEAATPAASTGPNDDTTVAESW